MARPAGTDAISPTARLEPRVRRAAAAGFVGTFIEFYDFALYGVLTVFFAPLFFPADDPATSLLTGLAVFGAGYVARPVGGIVFGWMGDRHGRRPALVATLVLMGLCSGLVGLLPTYETIGIWAPILLVALRLGQGISAGSEMLGSVTFVLESAPPSRRVFLASLTPFGAALGSAVATGSVWIGSTAGSAAWMSQTGWRVLFLIGFPLTAAALWIRSRTEDSPEFTKLVERKQVVKAPLRELLRSHWRPLLLGGLMAIAANGTAGVTAWFSTYLVGSRGLPGSVVFAALAIATLFAALTVPVSGKLTARFGRFRATAAILIAFVVMPIPVLWVIGSTTELLPLAIALFVYQMFASSMMPPVFTLIAHLFPVNVRYTGATTGQNIGTTFGAGLAPFVCAQLALGTGSSFGAAIWIVGIAVLGLVALAALARAGWSTAIDQEVARPDGGA